MEEIFIENAQIQMRKGTLEFCILHIISRGEVYASDMLEELKKAKLIVVEGTIYPLLSRLRKADLLDYKWIESVSGPPRKYYVLTKKGKEFLAELELKPGSYHIMLIGLKQDLNVGDHVTLTLHFKYHADITLTVPVQDTADMGGSGLDGHEPMP